MTSTSAAAPQTALRYARNSAFTRSELPTRNLQFRSEASRPAPTAAAAGARKTVAMQRSAGPSSSPFWKKKALGGAVLLFLGTAFIIFLVKVKFDADAVERAREEAEQRQREQNQRWWMLFGEEMSQPATFFLSEVVNALAKLSLCVVVPILASNLLKRLLIQRGVHLQRIALQQENMHSTEVRAMKEVLLDKYQKDMYVGISKEARIGLTEILSSTPLAQLGKIAGNYFQGRKGARTIPKVSPAVPVPAIKE